MPVYVVAVIHPDAYYLSPGEYVPDGAGAYVQRFADKREADNWILSPNRETYSTFLGECPFIVTNTRGRVL